MLTLLKQINLSNLFQVLTFRIKGFAMNIYLRMKFSQFWFKNNQNKANFQNKRAKFYLTRQNHKVNSILGVSL